jgi:hypothetical protein
MMAKIKADSAARAAAGTDKVLTREQRRALFAQKMQKLHPQNAKAPATRETKAPVLFRKAPSMYNSGAKGRGRRQ